QGVHVSAAEIRAALQANLAPHGKPGHIDSLLAAGGITLPIKALVAGRAEVRWGDLARGSRSFGAARTSTIRLRLTKAGRRALRRRGRGGGPAGATLGRVRTTRRLVLERGSDAAAARASFTRRLGGSQADAARAVAVDGAGNTYVTGETASPDFAVTLG